MSILQSRKRFVFPKGDRPAADRTGSEAATPGDGAGWRAMVLRVSVHLDRGEWEPMRRVARQLALTCADDSRWPLCVAYATRRLESVEQARAVLLAAEPHFPEDAGIQYNLSCFAAQLGDLREARMYLRRAFQLNPVWRGAALQESDLAPLWEDLDDLETS